MSVISLMEWAFLIVVSAITLAEIREGSRKVLVGRRAEASERGRPAPVSLHAVKHAVGAVLVSLGTQIRRAGAAML